jgi:hypothetical protein
MQTKTTVVIPSVAWPDGEPRSVRDAWDKQQDISRDNRQAETEPGHPGQVPAHLSADLREVRRQYSPAERQRIAAQRDMTPGAPHPNPELARRGWQASDRGIYVRRPPEMEREAG